MKAFVITFLFVAVFIFVSVSSYFVSVYNAAKAAPVTLASGKLEPIKDRLGGIADYSIGDLLLVKDGISAKNLGSRHFVYKLYDKNDTSNTIAFFLEDYQVGKIYHIYSKKGSCLWWHREIYRIGSE